MREFSSLLRKNAILCLSLAKYGIGELCSIIGLIPLVAPIIATLIAGWCGVRWLLVMGVWEWVNELFSHLTMEMRGGNGWLHPHDRGALTGHPSVCELIFSRYLW